MILPTLITPKEAARILIRPESTLRDWHCVGSRQLRGSINHVKSSCNCDIAHPPGAQRPGLIINPSTDMAWRPYANLIDGELNNSTPGKVTGWMRFFRRGMTPLRVTFGLVGDFLEDIHGRRIRLTNPQPSDEKIALDRKGTYMEKFAPAQSGVAGDITAGLPLGIWSEELAQGLMAKDEVVWNEDWSSSSRAGRAPGRCGPSATADTSQRATNTFPTWNTPTSSGTRARTVGWCWSWTLCRWKSSIRKDNP